MKKILTESHKQKIGLANANKKRTVEQCAEMSKIRKGKHYSPKTEFKKGSLGHPKEKSNSQIFLETGECMCNKHGVHSEWRSSASFDKRRGNAYSILSCKICGRESAKKQRIKNPDYQDKYRYSFNGMISRMLAQAKSHAKIKNVYLDITKKDILEMLEEQNNKCFYSGVKFDFNAQKKGYNGKNFYMPSIDQTIPSGGYTRENIKLVCVAVNLMKYDMPEQMFIEFCSEVHNYQKQGVQ